MGQNNNRELKAQPNPTFLPKLPSYYKKSQNQTHFYKTTESLSYPSLQKSPLLINMNEIQQFQDSLQFRRQFSQYFVQIPYGEVYLSDRQYYKFVLYVEEVVVKLNEINKVPFESMIKIFRKAVKGFDLLKQKYGAFKIQASMICLTQKGEAKIWHNKNSVIAMPIPTYKFAENNEEKMVKQIVDIYKCKVDKNTIPKRKDIEGKNVHFEGKTFKELLEQIQKQIEGQVEGAVEWASELKQEIIKQEDEEEENKSEGGQLRAIKSKNQKKIKFNYTNKLSSVIPSIRTNQPNIRLSFNNGKVINVLTNPSRTNLHQTSSNQTRNKSNIHFSYGKKENFVRNHSVKFSYKNPSEQKKIPQFNMKESIVREGFQIKEKLKENVSQNKPKINFQYKTQSK